MEPIESTFCENVKKELAEHSLNDCCAESRLYGIISFAKKLSKEEITIGIQNEAICEHIINLFGKFGIPLSSECIISTGRKKYITVKDVDITDRILSDYGYSGDEPNLRINSGNFLCNECAPSFVAGAFIAAGTVTDPNKQYHLEFSSHRQNLISDIKALLSDAGFEPKITKRKNGSYILYFKNSSQIEDILTYMGASDASLEIMQTKVLKDVRNVVNRRTNCENANIDKIVNSAANDIADIEYIIEHKGIDYLPRDLRESAVLRIDNPDLSLAELAAMCSENLTKSGFVHRLRKIREYAQILRNDDNGKDNQ